MHKPKRQRNHVIHGSGIPVTPSANRRIHDAVAECFQQAAQEPDRQPYSVYRQVQELIQIGWSTADAEQVGSRALALLEASKTLPRENPLNARVAPGQPLISRV